MRGLLATMCLALVAIVAACGGPPSSLFNAAGYHVRGHTVYYLDAFPGKAFEIEQADPKTFEILDSTYAKDKNAVYLNGTPLAEADSASFQLLDEDNYAKDSGHVFLRDRVLTEDVDHFEFLSGGGLSKDSEHVYWSDGRVLSDDPDHFEILPAGDGYLFTKDSSTVHVNGNPIKDADPATFEVIGGAYAKDADDVFYFADVVPDADSTKLEVLDGSYARDDNHAYWMGKEIPGADPKSFVVLNADFECTADSAHGYYRDLQIKDFDPGTIPKGAAVNNCSETFLSFS